MRDAVTDVKKLATCTSTAVGDVNCVAVYLSVQVVSAEVADFRAR